MSLETALLVLFAAFLHASWNAMVKAGRDPFVSQMVMFGTAGLWGGAAALFVPLPDPAAWPLLAGSVVVHVFYYYALAKGYTLGDLGVVYPIARGIAPMLVAVLAFRFAGEVPGPVEAAGVALISLGILSLALTRRAGDLDHGRAVLFAVLTGIGIAVYTTLDGIGVRRTAEPLSYISWLFFLEGAVYAVFVLVRRTEALSASLGRQWKRGVVGGTLAALGYAIVIWVMSREPMAATSALRESSVIMAAAMGALLLKEPFGPRRVAAAALVAAGVVALAAA